LEKIMRLLGYFFTLFAFAAGCAQAQDVGNRRIIFGSNINGGTIAQINSDGWSAQARAVSQLTFLPLTAPQYITVKRPGYTTSGTATTYTDSVAIVKQVRYPYPSYTSLNPVRVSLSDFVWASDTVVGAANTSTQVAPPPIVEWDYGGDRQTTTNNSITVQYVDASVTARLGRQTPYSTCSATDGTNTVTATATYGIQGGWATDVNPIIGYTCTLNVTSLNVGQVTVNAKVYPWIGTSASIADSSAGTAGNRGFVPQIWYKAASRYYAYAVSTGNDSTCVASTTAATASASPCATYVGAVNKCQATASNAGNCNIRLQAGTYVVTQATIASATNSEMVVESDPAIGNCTSVTFQFGATNKVFNEKYVRLRCMAIARQGIYSLTAASGGQVALENVAFDGSNGSIYTAFSFAGSVSINGMTATNVLNNTFQQVNTTQNIYLMRGVTDITAAATHATPPGVIVGSKFNKASFGYGSNTQYGDVFLGYSQFYNGGIDAGGSYLFTVGTSSATQTLSNFVFIQSVFEYAGTVTNPAVYLSGDPPINTSLQNVVIDYVTAVGGWNAGRWNVFYDNNSTAVVRNHFPGVLRNSYINQWNQKGDIFVGTNGADPTDAPLHIGNWSEYYGVGFRNNWIAYLDASSGSADGNVAHNFSPLFIGLNPNLGNSTTVPLNASFTAYAGTTYNGTTYTAGAGNGTYTLQGGSALKGWIPQSTLPFDLAGTARPSTGDTVGAYK
jgi:hypothetical protein